MRLCAAFLCLGLLAACGVDGAPQPPSTKSPTPATGVTISGEARVGVQTRL